MTDQTTTQSLFGHCAYGGPDLDKHVCPGRYQRFYFGTGTKNRKKVETVVYLDEWRECSCLCHIPEAERPKPKRTRKKKQ